MEIGGATDRSTGWLHARKADIAFVVCLAGLATEFVLHHDSPNLTWLAIFVPGLGLAPFVRALDYVRGSTAPSSPTSQPGPPSPALPSTTGGLDER